MYFDAKEFGKRLHDVRTSRGITQEELAVRLGLASKQHVSRMENGERSCSIDLLIELSCILHVSTDYGKVSYVRYHMLFGFRPVSGRESVPLVCPHCRL